MTHVRVLVPVVPSDSNPGPDRILEEYARLQSPNLVISCRMIESGPTSIERELHARGLLVTVLDPMLLTVRMAAILTESGHGHPRRAYMAPGN